MTQLLLTVIMGLVFLKTGGEPTRESLECIVCYSHHHSISLSLSLRLLSETNERRFDSRQVIALPRKRMKKRTEKSHLYDFPKPIWAKKKKKVLYNPGPEKNVKEEE